MTNIRISTGASSYFSKPSEILDPNLFTEREKLRPDVRQSLLNTLMSYMSIRYRNPQFWLVAWLAGSGISYQWFASRGNGDLDVLLGINYSEFVTQNPSFEWMDRSEIAETITKDLRENLWPQTTHTYIGYGEYEVTYFLNEFVEGSQSSIVNIHPYAAYSLNDDSWIVKPPKLPEDPHSLYPDEYYVQAQANKDAAQTIIDRYNKLNIESKAIYPGSPQDINNRRHKKLIQSEARNLFDNLHLGRKMAFSNQGVGYGDFYNFQWQAAKESGIINALNELINKEN